MENLRFALGVVCALLLSAILWVVVKVGLIVGLILMLWWLFSGA